MGGEIFNVGGQYPGSLSNHDDHSSKQQAVRDSLNKKGVRVRTRNVLGTSKRKIGNPHSLPSEHLLRQTPSSNLGSPRLQMAHTNSVRSRTSQLVSEM